MKMHVFFLMFTSVVTNALGAEIKSSENPIKKMGVSLSDGACSVVMQKEYQITSDNRTTSVYTADNSKLHHCQYIQEMANSPCIDSNTCPSYESWSTQHPDFTPSLSRMAFVAKLEERQRVVSALRAVRNASLY